MKKFAAILAVLLLTACTTNSSLMKITSSAFENNGNIPSKYTCDGANVNPPLNISEVPEGAKSLALIVDDPDAPSGDWVHWIIWNISVSTQEISEGSIPNGIVGTTSFGTTGYGGPCPPSGIHRYYFKLYALDEELNLKPDSNKEMLGSAMKEHVLEEAELMGKYSRQ